MQSLKYSSSTPLLILAGPTGSGKTALALELCRMLDGEIVSADSMQIYRGLDIGTAKATAQEQAQAPHHLIDIIAPDEEYSAAQWARDAGAAIAQIEARGKTPIIVGGTGFYLTALLLPERLASAPPNPELRAALVQIAAREGATALHARLQEEDSEAAARLHPNDLVRVTRALEVAAHRKQNPEAPPASEAPRPEYSALTFGLMWPREVLYERLDRRVDAMLQAGFMDELRAALNAGYGTTRPLQGLGYKQMRPALDDPMRFEEGVLDWQRETRRYAKRQLTWFRHQLPVIWLDAENTPLPDLATQITARWKHHIE